MTIEQIGTLLGILFGGIGSLAGAYAIFKTNSRADAQEKRADKQYADAAKKDALAISNAQIERMDKRIIALEGKVEVIEAERDTLKSTLNSAVVYIKQLRTIMEECQIAVPPIPEELAAHL